MERIQAAMAVIEGYSEHVMDAIAAAGDARAMRRLRAAMTAAARSRSAPERLIERLLGLDMKMRQYEQGKTLLRRRRRERRHRGPEPGLGLPEALPSWASSTRRRPGSSASAAPAGLPSARVPRPHRALM